MQGQADERVLPLYFGPVDTHLKERLVGAAVLVAVAVILIPEMLSGPAERQAPALSADRVADDGGVRTYTIDLGTRARSGAETPVVPSAEVVTPAPPPETIEEAESAPAATVAESPPPAESRPPTEAAPIPAPVAAAPAAPTVREAPPAPVRQDSGAKRPWAVQVGSFASQATADRLGQDLRKRGYESFVVPFKTGSQTLYRVRVGPMEDRTAADAAVQKLKREGTSATVVSNS